LESFVLIDRFPNLPTFQIKKFQVQIQNSIRMPNKRSNNSVQPQMSKDNSNPIPADFQRWIIIQFIFNSTNKFYNHVFESANTLKWCQKWDLNKSGIIDKLILLIQNFPSSINNKYFNNLILIIITTLYHHLFNHNQFLHFILILNRIGNSYNNILIYKCHHTIYYLYSISPQKHPLRLKKNYIHKKNHIKLFKIRLDHTTIAVPLHASKTISHAKCIIAKIIGYKHDDFYLSTKTKYLNESITLELFNLDYSEIIINFRIKGGSNDQNDEVAATKHTLNPHRPFFLDKDGTPNTWLLLLELSFSSCRYSSTTKAQHLIAFLPTEILQNIGPEIITIMNTDKSECDHFKQIRNLVHEFYKPSEAELFDKYFRAQSLGLLSPSQFLAKACSDLERLHPGSSSNVDILRRSFLAVLPPTARAILAGSDKSSLTDLANIADKVLLNLPNTTISHVDKSITELITTLSDQVASLQLEVTAQRQSRFHNRSIPHTSRPRSKSLSKIICSNHFKFKNNANKCCIGCTWMDKQNCTITQICVYHDIYASSAKRCLPGCTFTKN